MNLHPCLEVLLDAAVQLEGLGHLAFGGPGRLDRFRCRQQGDGEELLAPILPRLRHPHLLLEGLPVDKEWPQVFRLAREGPKSHTVAGPVDVDLHPVADAGTDLLHVAGGCQTFQLRVHRHATAEEISPKWVVGDLWLQTGTSFNKRYERRGLS